MTAYRGKAPTTKCARCSGRGYRFKVVGGELETVDCSGCDGRGSVDDPMITFTARVTAEDKDGDEQREGVDDE